MASTFSPNLRIELIGAGEQAGTWGTTTNTNLGTLIEDAISGLAQVTISSANQAFTAVNGAADQARNAIIQLNSASAAFAVYAPPESKEYTVFNNTNYTATIYNSTALGNTTAGGVGVAIPAGKIMTVWSNGTDFFVQNSLVLGDLTGVVTASAGSTAVTQSPGTNNTTIATTAFTAAAITAATGSLGTMSTQNANNVNISGGTVVATFTGNLTGNVTGNVTGNATTATTATTANNALGVGQTWQDVTGSRTLGTSYTNSTGRSIMVNIRVSNCSYCTSVLTVSGLQIGRVSNPTTSNGAEATMSAVVPNGATYTATGSVTGWFELR